MYTLYTIQVPAGCVEHEYDVFRHGRKVLGGDEVDEITVEKFNFAAQVRPSDLVLDDKLKIKEEI